MLSIYETVKKNPTAILPDQDTITLKDGESWMAGAYEGTLLRSTYSLKQHSFTNHKIARIVKKYILNPNAENMKVVEDTFEKYTAISVTDYVLSFMSRMKLNVCALHDGALQLAVKSHRRETVKFAIALLGDKHCRIDSERQNDAKIVKTLSLNEEFTLYGLVAIKNILPGEQSRHLLLDMGERLSGWGKIALMYELDYTDPQVRLWTLKNGCQNTIGLSYLANVCAIKGKLKDYLQDLEDNQLPMEPEYLPGICNIFQGLLECHQENDSIYEYPDAVEASDLFRAAVKRSSAEIKNAAEDVIHKLNSKRIGHGN